MQTTVTIHTGPLAGQTATIIRAHQVAGLYELRLGCGCVTYLFEHAFSVNRETPNPPSSSYSTDK